VNRFKEYLSGKYSSNTVRLTLASCSSFYTYLDAEEYITRSPFANIKYPRKVYKKAVKTDQGSPVPVMNQGEYRVIMETIRQKAREARKRASVINSRQSARQLFPIVRIMAEYGLRIGDVLTVRLEEGERFSVRTKGGQVRSFELRPETRSIWSNMDIQNVNRFDVLDSRRCKAQTESSPDG
jgi:integrase